MKLDEAIQNWKNGELVSTIELGGMGPGYEQAIQILLWEILSTWDQACAVVKDEEYTEAFKLHADSIATKLNASLGFSGAQVGAAKSAAARILHRGYEKSLSEVDSDRRIMASKNFPTWNEATAVTQ